MPWSVVLKDGSGIADVTVRRVHRRSDIPEPARSGYSESYGRFQALVGDVYAGDLFRGNAPGAKRIEWTAISAVREPRGLRMVSGFGTRRDAVTYLLRTGGWWD